MRARGADRVEDHRGRVAAFLLHDGHVVAFAPDRQLFARRGTESIARGEQHRLFEALQMLRELADAGRLAGTVHARDHHHERLRAAEYERLLERRQQLDEQVAQRALHLLRVGQAAHPHLFAQRAEQVLGRVDARIGHQQRGFELLVQRVVDLRVHEYAGDARARFREARLQAREP